jgi:2-hydroxychromene-2-carboxylate isomerase
MAADIPRFPPGVRMPRQVDYYFSFQSPWAYIGHKLFREVASTYDLIVNHKPVVLVDLFSETGGLPLMKRHPVRQRYRMVELQRWRDKRGLKFHLQPANWRVQRAAGRWRGDRGDRGRPRSRALRAAGVCRGVGGPAQPDRSGDAG